MALNLAALAALAISLWLFFHGLLPVVVSQDELLIPVPNAEGKIGFITRRGRVVSAFRWERTDGYDTNGLAPVSLDKKVGWIDRKGVVVMPPQWEMGVYDEEDNLPLIIKGFDARGWARVGRDGKFGWVDRAGRVMLPLAWSSSLGFGADGLAVVFKEGRTGWINREGKWVWPPEWDFVHEFDGAGMALVVKDKRWGWINREGKMAVPLEWEEAWDFDDGGLAMVRKERKTGWINREGAVVIPLDNSYYLAKTFDGQGMIRVRKGGPMGWINREGKTVGTMDWRYGEDFDAGGMARVMKDREWGWINRSGELAIPCRFDWAGDFDRFGEAWAMADGWLGRINRAGAWTKATYHPEVKFMDARGWSGLAVVKLEDKTKGCLGRSGQWIVPAGTWKWVDYRRLFQRDHERRYSLITASDRTKSSFAPAWLWLTDRVPLLEIGNGLVIDHSLYIVYDSIDNQIIWTSGDRKREIWWATGLAAVAAGAWFWGRRKERAVAGIGKNRTLDS